MIEQKEAFKYLPREEQHLLNKCYPGPSIYSITSVPRISLLGWYKVQGGGLGRI